MTLADLSPFDLRRERLGRQLEGKFLTRAEFEAEKRAIEREEREERDAQRRAKRCTLSPL